MKFVLYKCDNCDKSINRDEVCFVNYKNVHKELCKKCFDNYRKERTLKLENKNKENFNFSEV